MSQRRSKLLTKYCKVSEVSHNLINPSGSASSGLSGPSGPRKRKKKKSISPIGKGSPEVDSFNARKQRERAVAKQVEEKGRLKNELKLARNLATCSLRRRRRSTNVLIFGPNQIDAVFESYKNCTTSKDGCLFDDFAHHFNAGYRTFKPEHFGYRSFSDIILDLGVFQLIQKRNRATNSRTNELVIRFDQKVLKAARLRRREEQMEKRNDSQ
jgi:hypothetical protein